MAVTDVEQACSSRMYPLCKCHQGVVIQSVPKLRRSFPDLIWLICSACDIICLQLAIEESHAGNNLNHASLHGQAVKPDPGFCCSLPLE